MSYKGNVETTHLITDKQRFAASLDKSRNGSIADEDSLRQSKTGTSEAEFFQTSGRLNSRSVHAAIQQTIISQQIQELTNNPPKDRYNVVYMLMIIHGIAILIPWNMFINAKDYFENYKLDNGNKSSSSLLDYKTNFMSYIGMASQYPCFFMNFLNLFLRCKGNSFGSRILTSIGIAVVMFTITVILAITDTSSWPELFFWITVASAIVINAAVGMYQNSIYGVAAILPMKYTNAVIFGNNVSGTLVAVTNIIVLVVSPSKKTAAIYYFVVAIVILLVAFDAYFIAFRCKFYRHFMKLAELTNQEYHVTTAKSEPYYMAFLTNFIRVFKQIYHLSFGVWFTFFITLALFPAVMSDVKPLTVPLSGEYWTAIFCFLCFNIFAIVGNLTTEFIRWPNARWINILVILRLCFVPLMILGNFRPDLRTLPVFIPYDSVFIISAILFSFTNGYCSSLVMMYAPKCVAPNDSSIAGMTMAIFLVFGVLCGINFSRFWGLIVGSG